MRCFINDKKTCTPTVHEEEEPRCRMWDTTNEECLMVQFVRDQVGVRIVTTFPSSAPPPEVK